MNTRTLLIHVLTHRTELVSAALVWLPELLWITAFLAFAGVFGLWWLIPPAVLIAAKIALQVRAERRQNQHVAQLHLWFAARRAADQAQSDTVADAEEVTSQ